VTGPKHVVYKSNKYYTTIFSCVRLLLPLHHIMYPTGMLQLKITLTKFCIFITYADDNLQTLCIISIQKI